MKPITFTPNPPASERTRQARKRAHREAKREPICCRKCGVELSLNEALGRGVVFHEGTPVLDCGELCFICRGDKRERAGFSRSEE